MLSDTNAILYWLNGVIAQPLVSVISEFMNIYGSPVPVQLVVDLRKLQAPLSLGRIDEKEYCFQVIKLLNLKMSSDELDHKIRSSIKFDQSVLDLIERLPSFFQNWLLVDIPKAWFDPLAKGIYDHPFFTRERTLFLRQSHIIDESKDLFSTLIEKSHQSMAHCLLVDADSKRAIRAINYGLPSIIYVNARNLEREFGLREFISDPYYLSEQKNREHQ